MLKPQCSVLEVLEVNNCHWLLRNPSDAGHFVNLHATSTLSHLGHCEASLPWRLHALQMGIKGYYLSLLLLFVILTLAESMARSAVARESPCQSSLPTAS